MSDYSLSKERGFQERLSDSFFKENPYLNSNHLAEMLEDGKKCLGCGLRGSCGAMGEDDDYVCVDWEE